MPTVVLAEDILRDCIHALRPVADYELEPALDRRLNDLGERKEFLTQEEHAELLDLVAFVRRRSLWRSSRPNSPSADLRGSQPI